MKPRTALWSQGMSAGSAVISAATSSFWEDCTGKLMRADLAEDCYIVALEMEPERLKIGDFKYKTNAKQSKWGIRPKVQPVAHLKNGKIVFDPLQKNYWVLLKNQGHKIKQEESKWDKTFPRKKSSEVISSLQERRCR
ncbi:MAG: hypothetical protein ACLUH9_09070 [Waltera sp.]